MCSALQVSACADVIAMSTRELGVVHLRAASVVLGYGDCGGWRTCNPIAMSAKLVRFSLLDLGGCPEGRTCQKGLPFAFAMRVLAWQKRDPLRWERRPFLTCIPQLCLAEYHSSVRMSRWRT